MDCKFCGTENPDSAAFCKHCGKPMNGMLPIIATVLSVLALAALIVYAALPTKKTPENA